MKKIIVLLAAIYLIYTAQVIDNRIEFDLTVKRQKNLFEKMDSPEVDYCAQQNTDLYTPDKKYNQKCRGDNYYMIEKDCEINNISYNVEVYFNVTTASLFKNLKGQSYQLQLDLSSPWSWAKDNSCQHCNRSGTNCQKGCITDKHGSKYEQLISCADYSTSACKAQQECGIMAIQGDGLSVQGKFADVYLRFDQEYRIKSYRVLLAYQTGFQQNLMAEGQLGLGPEYADNQNHEYMYDQYQNHLEKTSFIDKLQITYPDIIETKSFSLYLGDEPQLIVGALNTEYIHDNELDSMRYANLPIINEEDRNSRYYQWAVTLKRIEIMFVEEGAKKVTWKDRHIMEDFTDVTATLSISTSALVLPEQHMNYFIENLSAIYNMDDCKVDDQRRNFLICSNLQNETPFRDIMIHITIEPDIKIHINPNDLVKQCTKQKKNKFTCILEIQQSFNNNQIVLGEVALRNTYIDFDMDNRQIGFAHSNNNYIRDVLKRLENISIELVDDMISELAFVLKFYSIILILILGFVALKNVNYLVTILDKMCFKILHKRLIQDNMETQRLTNNAEMSVIKTDDDDHIDQRIFNMQIETQETSGNLEDCDNEDI